MLLLHKNPYPDLLSLDVASDTVATLLRWTVVGRLGAQPVADDLQFWDITQPDRYFHIPLWADDLTTASGWEDRDQESENSVAPLDGMCRAPFVQLNQPSHRNLATNRSLEFRIVPDSDHERCYRAVHCTNCKPYESHQRVTPVCQHARLVTRRSKEGYSLRRAPPRHSPSFHTA
jgi:hypothetical protein